MNFGEFAGRGAKEQDPSDIGLSDHSVSWVNFDGTPAADDDDATVRRDQFQIIGKVDVRQHLENEVDTTAIRPRPDGVQVAGGLVIESGVHSLTGEQVSS